MGACNRSACDFAIYFSYVLSMNMSEEQSTTPQGCVGTLASCILRPPWTKNLDWARDLIEKPHPGHQRSISRKHATSLSFTPEPAIRSRDTGQWKVWFDSCQLTIAWMPKIKCVAMVMLLLSYISRYWPYGRKDGLRTFSHVTSIFFVLDR